MISDEFQIVGLYDHNADSYKKVREAFDSGEQVVGIVHATGTGKSYNALQLAYDNKDKKIIYVVPSNGIIEHIKKIINDNPNLNFRRDFSNLEFRTYQSFISLDEEEIEDIDCDLLILDEFHHIGAPVWGVRINTMIETHPEMKIFGMTAYTVRDRGTSYERDMANSDTDELFSGKIVSRYDLVDAMIDGVLPKPVYKSAYINLIGLESKLEERVKKLNPSSLEYREYMKILSDLKKRIQEAPSIPKILEKSIKPNGKYIYFCPPCSEDGTNDIETIKREAMEWFKQFVPEEDIIFYTSTSDMGDEGKLNRDAFYDDITVEGEKADNKLRIMFAINQYNEGIHAPNIDGVIMGRGTTSDIVYFEQLGRALSVRGNTKEMYEALEEYSIEELKEMCKTKDIIFKEDATKEELIEKLIAPIVIDLTNNFDFIRELENNLKDRIRTIQSGDGLGIPRDIKLNDASFDIEIENQDIFEMLKYLSNRLTMTWEDYYELAKAYHEHHGDLEIPSRFKTINGYEYDENGIINLGRWILTQRQTCSIESKRGQLLSQIGMRFENKIIILPWEEMYKYAKFYYEHHGNLEISQSFKTNDGYTYDENGTINLGKWISNQRKSCSPKSERGQLLLQIGMRFQNRISTLTWEEMYKYAKFYYEYYGNLEIPFKYKTNNGYTYDENGTINLGQWISTQRRSCPLKSERGQLLSQIGMRFENIKSTLTWEEMYEYARIYYEHNGNLEIKSTFKTNNGYTYDENGTINLGQWILTQRRSCPLESERGQLLSQIGMRFENIKSTLSWEEMYDYAKAYYEHYGNLEMPRKFKTNDGYTYDEDGTISLENWIRRQRKSCPPESERGQLLSQIGMSFEKLTLPWEEMYEYARIYYEHHGNLEIPFKYKTNNGYTSDENGTIKLGVWITTQRRNCSPESEQGKLLLKIGMRFEKIKSTLPWEDYFELAKAYYSQNGNLEIPFKYKTNNGYEYDENGTINLGQWISTQRRICLLESERGQLLSQIGMRFENIKSTLSWEEMYDYSKAYYEHHGNLKVPRFFKTNDGYTPDENGKINIGIWISHQRKNCSPESDHGQLLSQIGMIWDVKKNKEEIISMCKQYNIDYEKNKTILKYISIQELQSKIEFLNANNISLVDANGLLIDIFTMSSLNMQEKYGVSLEELITQYYLKDKKSKGV